MRQTNLSAIDLNLLVALEVILEELHVSRAANRLNMSQPNMSRTLGRLRDIFDDPLIERVGGRYVKTTKAEQLETEIRPTLARLRGVLEPTSFSPSATQAIFRFFASDYCEAVLMPRLMANFIVEAPNAQLEVVRLTKSLAEEMHDGPYDIVLGNVVPKGFPKECEYESLFEDRFVCVMRKDHPVARSGLALENYLACDHAVVGTARGLTNWIDAKLHSLGHQRHIVKLSPYVLASLFSLRESDLLQSSPLRLVSSLLEPLGLVAVDLPFDSVNLTYCQIWHSRNTNSSAHRWFRGQVLKAARTINQNQ